MVARIVRSGVLPIITTSTLTSCLIKVGQGSSSFVRSGGWVDVVCCWSWAHANAERWCFKKVKLGWQMPNNGALRRLSSAEKCQLIVLWEGRAGLKIAKQWCFKKVELGWQMKCWLIVIRESWAGLTNAEWLCFEKVQQGWQMLNNSALRRSSSADKCRDIVIWESLAALTNAEWLCFEEVEQGWQMLNIGALRRSSRADKCWTMVF